MATKSPGVISQLATYLRSLANTSSEEAYPGPIRLSKAIHDAIDKQLHMDVTAGAPAIVFSKAESSDLVDTLGSSSHPWSRLDSVSFSKIALVLMYTEACPAQNEGLFRLYTTLEDLVDKLDEQRYAFKDAVGQALLNPLAIFFLDRRINTLARRWVGLILVNLLETEGNRATLLKICGSDANATRLHFGKIVVEGIYKILKVIAGRVISDLSYDYKYDPESLREFLLSFLPNDQDAFDFLFECGDEFPVDGSPSQWEAQLFEYTSRIEGVRENLKLRSPLGFYSFVVKIGGNSIGFILGGICCDMGKCLSIRIPNASIDKILPHWIDIEMANIESAELQDIPVDEEEKQSALTIHLTDYKELGYLFLLDMEPKAEPNEITLHIFTDEAENILGDLGKARKAERRNWNAKRDNDINCGIGGWNGGLELPASSQQLQQLTQFHYQSVRLVDHLTDVQVPGYTRTDAQLEETQKLRAAEIENGISGSAVVHSRVGRELLDLMGQQKANSEHIHIDLSISHDPLVRARIPQEKETGWYSMAISKMQEGSDSDTGSEFEPPTPQPEPRNRGPESMVQDSFSGEPLSPEPEPIILDSLEEEESFSPEPELMVVEARHLKPVTLMKVIEPPKVITVLGGTASGGALEVSKSLPALEDRLESTLGGSSTLSQALAETRPVQRAARAIDMLKPQPKVPKAAPKPPIQAQVPQKFKSSPKLPARILTPKTKVPPKQKTRRVNKAENPKDIVEDEDIYDFPNGTPEVKEPPKTSKAASSKAKKKKASGAPPSRLPEVTVPKPLVPRNTKAWGNAVLKMEKAPVSKPQGQKASKPPPKPPQKHPAIKAPPSDEAGDIYDFLEGDSEVEIVKPAGKRKSGNQPVAPRKKAKVSSNPKAVPNPKAAPDPKAASKPRGTPKGEKGATVFKSEEYIQDSSDSDALIMDPAPAKKTAAKGVVTKGVPKKVVTRPKAVPKSKAAANPEKANPVLKAKPKPAPKVIPAKRPVEDISEYLDVKPEQPDGNEPLRRSARFQKAGIPPKSLRIDSESESDDEDYYLQPAEKTAMSGKKGQRNLSKVNKTPVASRNKNSERVAIESKPPEKKEIVPPAKKHKSPSKMLQPAPIQEDDSMSELSDLSDISDLLDYNIPFEKPEVSRRITPPTENQAVNKPQVETCLEDNNAIPVLSIFDALEDVPMVESRDREGAFVAEVASMAATLAMAQNADVESRPSVDDINTTNGISRVDAYPETPLEDVDMTGVEYLSLIAVASEDDSITQKPDTREIAAVLEEIEIEAILRDLEVDVASRGRETEAILEKPESDFMAISMGPKLTVISKDAHSQTKPVLDIEKKATSNETEVEIKSTSKETAHPRPKDFTELSGETLETAPPKGSPEFGGEDQSVVTMIDQAEFMTPAAPTTPKSVHFRMSPYQPIDENLVRKPQIIAWDKDGPRNQGRLMPKSPRTPQAPIKPSAPRIPQIQLQPETEGRMAVPEDKTPIGLQIQLQPGVTDKTTMGLRKHIEFTPRKEGIVEDEYQSSPSQEAVEMVIYDQPDNGVGMLPEDAKIPDTSHVEVTSFLAGEIQQRDVTEGVDMADQDTGQDILTTGSMIAGLGTSSVQSIDTPKTSNMESLEYVINDEYGLEMKGVAQSDGHCFNGEILPKKHGEYPEAILSITSKDGTGTPDEVALEEPEIMSSTPLAMDTGALENAAKIIDIATIDKLMADVGDSAPDMCPNPAASARRRTVDITGSPLPKLIPSQKDMEEANSQPIRAARPPAPNFIKSDPRPKRAQPGLLETMESTPKPARCGTTVKPAKQDPPKPVESGLRPANDRITAAPAQMGFGSVVSTQEKRNPQAEHTQTEPSRPAKLLHMHIAKLAKVPHALKPTEPLKASSIPKHIKKEPSPTPSLFSDSSESSESSDWGNSQPIFEVLAPRIGGSSDRAIVLEDTPPPKTPEKKRVMFSNKLGISNIPDNKRPQRIPTNPQPRRRQAASSTLPEINTLVKTDMRDRFQEILRFAAMSHTKKTAMEDREDPPTPAEHGRLFEQLVKNGIVSNESQPGKPPDDPDNTLVNEGDEGDGYPNDSDSDSSDEDSLDSGTWQSDGDSDRGDMEDWREALPDYHAQTFAVLEQIAKKWMLYLMSGEERTHEAIKDYERSADASIESLRAFHQKEYDEFMQKLRVSRESITTACDAAQESIVRITTDHSILPKLGDMSSEMKRGDTGFMRKTAKLEKAMKAKERALDAAFDLKV